jgi:hypothetical protein
MAGRLIRNTIAQFKREVTPNTDSVPAGADSILVLTGADFEPDFAMIDRELARPFLGASSQLVGRKLGKLSCRYELAGSGTAGTAPVWADLFLALGFAEAVLASPARVEYTPVSDLFKTGTCYVYAAGVLYKMVGCLGNASLDFTVGQTPKAIAEYTGLYVSEAAATTTIPGMGNWQKPVVVNKASVVDITMGATYAAGALSGGTVVPSRGITFDLGNDVQHTDLCSSDFMSITGRNIKATVSFDFTAAQEITYTQGVQTSTLQSMAFTVGLTSGNKMILYCPRGQLVNPRVENVNGVRLMKYDAILVPSNNGNDELQMVLL